MRTMKAARVYELGAPLRLDEVERPSPRPTDVLVRVKACNLVPNLTNVLTIFASWFPYLPLPKLPGIFGLDVSGVIEEVGAQVHGVKVGDRVYVNPGRSCGSCTACRAGEPTACQSYTFQGYFGFGPGSAQVFEDYPGGGLAEFMTAPSSSLVKLEDSITFEEAARFGYIGTAYGALKRARAGSGRSLVVTGATGTLGVHVVMLALAMGVTKIFAVARDKNLLAQVKQLDPGRIHVLSYGEVPMAEWVRSLTDGAGADIFVDALSTGAPAQVTMDGLHSLRRGGIGVGAGGMKETLPIEPIWFMTSGLSWLGSVWFSTAEGQELSSMAGAGTLDLSVLRHSRFALSQVNEALEALDHRSAGGFENVVVMPELDR